MVRIELLWFGNQCSVSRRSNLYGGLGCCPA